MKTYIVHLEFGQMTAEYTIEAAGWSEALKIAVHKVFNRFGAVEFSKVTGDEFDRWTAS